MHKRKHSFKSQELMTQDEMTMHAWRPTGGRRLAWTLYRWSGLDEELQNFLLIEGRQFSIYGDPG